MNRLTALVDIAGRVSKDTFRAPRVTAAAVLIATADEETLRKELGSAYPKWGQCTYADAERIIDLLQRYSIAVGVMSIDKDTDAWRSFAKDAEILQKAILRESRKVAGWAKPSVFLTYILLASATAIATGHGVRIDRTPSTLGTDGLRSIERKLIFDSEVSGKENVEVFRSFLEREAPEMMFAKLGVRLPVPTVDISNEQDEPLLLLADYAAGISHSLLLPNPGVIRMPLPHIEATRLAAKLHTTGQLVITSTAFSHSYDEIYGEVMRLARMEQAR